MNIELNYQESLTFHMDEHSVKLSYQLKESLTFHMDEHSIKLSGKPNFPYG